jgi:hypothetical protein
MSGIYIREPYDLHEFSVYQKNLWLEIHEWNVVTASNSLEIIYQISTHPQRRCLSMQESRIYKHVPFRVVPPEFIAARAAYLSRFRPGADREASTPHFRTAWFPTSQPARREAMLLSTMQFGKTGIVKERGPKG